MKTVLVLFFLFASIYCQCRKDSLDNAFAELNQAINRFDNIFDESAPFGLLGPLAKVYTNGITPCLVTVGTMLGSVVKENVTFATRECPLDKDDPARANDPCCNFKTRFTKCCVTRDVTVQRDFIRTFNPLINTQCKTPAKVKALIRHFQRNYDGRDGFCDILQAKRIAAVYTMQQKMSECLNEYLFSSKPCTQASDCVSNVCNAETEQCAAGFLDAPPEPLAKCLFDSIPKFAIRAFAIYNNITSIDVAVSQVTSMISNAVFKDSCVNYLYSPNPLLTTQSACEAAKVCTDGTLLNCPNNNPFCGALCSKLNEQCGFNIGVINNQQVCESFGQCIGKNPQTGADLNDNLYTNATECATQKICTAVNCYPNCTESKCLSLGRCVGFPSQPGTPACVVPFTIPEDGNVPNCPTAGDVNVGVGCFRPSITTQQACASANGMFYNYPANQAECENFAVCREVENNNALTLKTAAECAKCNGIMWKPFTWLQAKWRNRVFIQRTAWTQRKQVNANKWVKTLDFGGFAGFVLAAIRAVAYPIYKSTLLCKVEPVYRAFSTLACDCGADKSTSVDCFANLSAGTGLRLPSVGLGAIRVFAGVSQNFSLGDATISLAPGSVSISNDNINIVISKNDVIVSSQSDVTARSTMQTTKNIPVVVNAAGVSTGQLVGDGITIGTSFASDVNLCIKRNPDMNIQNAAYNTPAFATFSTDKYVVSSAVVTRADAVEVCANVRNADTYYPAYVTTTPTTSGKKNSASVLTLSILAMFISLLALFL